MPDNLTDLPDELLIFLLVFISPTTGVKLSSTCRRLRSVLVHEIHVSVRIQNYPRQEQMHEMCALWKRAQSLTIDNINLQDPHLEICGQLRHLRQIRFLWCKEYSITKRGLSKLCLHSLTSLTVDGGGPVKNRLLAMLPLMEQLQCIVIAGFPFTEKTVACLNQCPRLTQLVLQHVSLRPCTDLLTKFIRQNQISYLDVAGCRNVRKQTIQLLATSCSSLRTFRFNTEYEDSRRWLDDVRRRKFFQGRAIERTIENNKKWGVMVITFQMAETLSDDG